MHPQEPPPFASALTAVGRVSTGGLMRIWESPTTDAPAAGSRRRRLWELQGPAHCPVVGVCLPMAALRRLMDKLGAAPLADDYELHCSVVGQCKLRSPVAEALHKELDRRYALSLQRAARHKTPQALAAWWQEASAGTELAGALWATLTHPRCTPELAQQVLGEVHMLQHQVGMATRVELRRFESLIDENAVLARELAAAQARSQRLATEQARRCEALSAELLQARAQGGAAADEAQRLREQLGALHAAAPDLGSRVELARVCREQLGRIQALERQLLRAQQEAERQQRRAEEALALALPGGPPQPLPSPVAGGAPLGDRAILCVGGRPGSLPVYRQVVERCGARFMHHDGGDEQNVARLDATLAAADLVICQAGCVSHDAYWRVKDHCRRTGKRCVFVESPSRAALERALSEVQDLPG